MPAIPDTSHAMVLEAPEVLVPAEFAIPALQDDDGLLEVEMAGICHTDVELYRGSTTYALPIIPGHEIVGRIAAVGPVAAARWGVREGDRVAVESIVRCGFCRNCILGRYKYCADVKVYGTFTSCTLPPHLWGSYSEYLYLAPGAIVHKVPGDMSPELATLLTVAIANGIQWTTVKGEVRLGSTVVIQGVGPIGLSAAAAAHAAGAALVVATGLGSDGYRLDLAREFGADVVIDVEADDIVDRVREATGGTMADVVLDTTGSPSAIVTSTKLVRPGGTVVNAGLTGDETLSPIALDALMHPEIRLQHVFTYEYASVRAALALASTGRYPFERLITHHYTLDRAEEAIRMSAREIPGEQPIKVAIVPNGRHACASS
jgi:alcohol dehydrogenase